MTSGSGERARWDEAAALEELERLQRGIEEWRRRRNDVQAEFERFVRGFRRTGQAQEAGSASLSEGPRIPPPVNGAVSASVPPAAIVTPGAATTAGATPIIVAPTPGSTEAATPTLASEASLASIPTAAPASKKLSRSPGGGVATELEAWLASQSWQRSRVMAGAGAVALVIVTGALLIGPAQNPPDEPSRSGPQSAPSSTPPASQRSVPPSQPAASFSDPGPPPSEIVALERVWVRVVVDGTREVERELEAGERVPLAAGRTSVVRAGNAGAVRVTINGEDRGTLGPEGEPITRTLRPPAVPAR